MKLNKTHFNFVCVFLFFIIGISLISSYSISSTGSNSQVSSNIDPSMCQQAQDLVIQVAPFGCSPLRTDLLEEQDVTVYCKLQAMKINPLVNVKSIDSISFSNKNYSPQISSVAFFPANAYSGNKEVLTSSLFNDIGFLAVTVKKQTNHSLIPELISGTLTAQVKYNMGEEFGIGKTSFYLRGVEEDSQENNEAFSFWDNIGHLKLQTIDNEKAEISVYFSDREIETVTLKKGETSNKIILPTSQCGSGLNLKLEDFNSLATTAKIRVDSEVVEVAKGEKFLNNKCFVKEIINNGLSKYVKISCKDNKGNQELSLSITPKVNLSIDGEIKSYELGDYLFDSDGKKVYLIYIGGKEGDLLNNENLILFFAALPKSDTNKLSQSELSSFKEVIAPIAKEKLNENDNGILKSTSKILTDFGTWLSEKFKKAFTGEEVLRLEFGQTFTYEGKEIFISSLTSSQNTEFASSEKEGYYNNAFEEYQKLIDDFSDTNYGLDKLGNEITYGEKAFRNQILLAYSAGQQATLEELCSKFKENYPGKDLPSECSPNKILNSQISESYLTIEGENRVFSLESIYEPGFKEYSVKIKIINSQNQETEYRLEKDKAVSFPGLNGHLILTEIKDENSATIFFSLDNKDNLKKLREDLDLVSDKKTLQKNIEVYSKQLGYSFVVTDINLKKSAKVTLNSDAAKLGTKTNFSFKIEIEDRNIQLSPEMTNKTIDFLNKSINTLTGVSNFLESWVEIQTGACYATAGLLTINSFFQGNVAGFNARQTIMRGINGWMERCNSLVKNGEYSSSSACLLDKSDTIDKQVEELSQSIETQNNNIDSLSASIKQTSSVKAQEQLVDQYCKQVQTLLTNLPQEKLTSLNIVNEDISMLKLENWKIGKFTIEQLKSIGTYVNLLAKTSDSELQNLAKSELTSLFEKIKQTAKIEEQASSFFSTYGIEKGIVQDLSQSKIIKLYSVQKRSEMPSSLNTLFSSSLNQEDYVQGIYDFKAQKSYLIGIDSSPSSNFEIKSTYIFQDDGKLILFDNSRTNPLNLKIEFYAKTEYNNVYVNPELKYYDTEPYKGLPAVVPVDVKQGWYAVIKQTISSGGNIPSYDDSGKVKSFYLGNVGTNGKFEFEINGGDDTYKSINLDSVDPYSFPGLTFTKAKEIIRKAEESIEQAEAIKESQRKGKVKINGQEVNIGQAAASSIQMSCEDVLSPKECAVLFNVCDPVICPASRCDFFGNYKNNPQNVKQKGIIGGLTFCLGNFVGFGGDVIMPVCVDGVKAGVDNLISILNQTSKCLKKNLETGETVGICDEAQSIYLCDILWKEAISSTGDLVSLGLNYLGKKNDKKGGEYFNLQEQVSLSQNTMNFFLNSYSSDLQKAFLTKTTKEIGTGICKSFVSGVFPSGSEILSQLVKSESPVQFTGHFDEIVFTTATVPAISHYKVFYHVYAGKDSVAYYSIYLRATQTSNPNPDKLVDSGTIEIGGSLTETKDLTAPAGYNQLCINVNGQEECGFREVSTSFGIDAIKEMYVSELSGKTQIVSEKDCRSGTILSYGVELYNQGIIRECSTSNPGISTDPYVNTEKSRWKEVGYCGESNIKCWIDTNSIKDTLEIGGLEDKAIDEITKSDLAALGLGGYLTSSSELDAKIKEIEQQDENTKEGLLKRISLIDAIIDKVAILDYKTKLLLLKGDAYKLLFGLQIVKAATPTSTESEIPSGLSQIRKAILKSAKELDGTSANRRLSQLQITNLNKLLSTLDNTKRIVQADINNLEKIYENAPLEPTATCSDATAYVYSKAKGELITVTENYEFPNGAKSYLFYSDEYGTEYTIKLKDNKKEKIEIKENYPFRSYPDSSPHTNKDQDYDTEQEKLDSIEPGDILDLFSDTNSGHSVIFIGWKDKPNRIAQLFDWNNNKKILSESGNPIYWYTDKNSDDLYYLNKKFRYFSWDISDDSHPVYVIYKPEKKSETAGTGGSATGSPGTAGGSGEYAPLGEEGEDKTETEQTAEQAITEATKKIDEIASSSNPSSLNPVGDILREEGVEINLEGISKAKEVYNKLNNNNNFILANPSNLKNGDFILFGKDCDYFNSWGMVKNIEYTDDYNAEVEYYTFSLDTYNFALSFGLQSPTKYETEKKQVSINTIQIYNEKNEKSNKEYIYRAYRYVGPRMLQETKEKLAYTSKNSEEYINLVLDLNEKSTLRLDAYNLPPFITEIYIDLFTKSQCNQAKSKNFGWLLEQLGYSLQKEQLEDFKSVSISQIEEEGYTEINPKLIQNGDWVYFGKGCEIFKSPGQVVSSFDDLEKGKIKVIYLDESNKKIEFTTTKISDIEGGYYIYKAYRLSSTLTPKDNFSPRISWTLRSALDKMSELVKKLDSSNSYDDPSTNTKSLIDEFILDEVFDNKQCNDITGGFGLWGAPKNPKTLQQILEILKDKCNMDTSCSNSQQSSSEIKSSPRDIINRALSIAESNLKLKESDTISSILNKGGITQIKENWGDFNLIKYIKSNSNQFVKIKLINLKKGDIVFLGAGCDMEQQVGIVKEVSGSSITIYFSSSKDNGVIKTQLFSNLGEITYPMNNLFIYNGYRFIEGLSESEKGNIKNDFQTYTYNYDDGMTELQSLSPSLNYQNSKEFRLLFGNLVFDKVISKSACETLLTASYELDVQQVMDWINID